MKMKIYTIIISCLFILCISEASASAYNRGLVIGVLKNRFQRNIHERKKYEELNNAICVESNPSHNPFIPIIEKYPTKCYDEDKKPELHPVSLCFIFLVMLLFIYIAGNDPEMMDFIIGMLVADMIEEIFNNNRRR